MNIDTPEFQRLLDEAYGAAADARRLGYEHGTAGTLYQAESKLIEYINARINPLSYRAIKTWQERCEWDSAEPAVWLMVQAMKEEIAELRSLLATEPAEGAK